MGEKAEVRMQEAEEAGERVVSAPSVFLIVPEPPLPWVQTDEPLLWLNGGAYEVREHPSYFFDCRTRNDDPHFALQLTLSGAGFYTRQNKRTLLTRGMAFFDRIPGEFLYGYPPEATEPYEFVYLSLRGLFATQWCGHIIQTYGTVLDFGQENPIASLMLSIAHQVRHRLIKDRYRASAQVYNVLMTMLSCLNQSRVATSPLVARAMEFIHDHAHDRRLSIQKLADMLEVSREHLAREFQATMGVSPLDYLTQHRLRMAREKLRYSSDKLEIIAASCGFEGANYFCRLFRRHVGVTPAAFRKQPTLIVP